MNNDDLLTTSIDEYLISLADSVNHAQRHISTLRVRGQEGQPTIGYQLPRVDFELKMEFQVVSRPPPGSTLQRNMAITERGAFLEARPISGRGDGGKTTSDVVSTIKGSFLAVPLHGGNAPPLVDVSWQRIDEDGVDRFLITVSAFAAGTNEPLTGREVQFNVDRDLLVELAEADGVDASTASSTDIAGALTRSVTEIDEKGYATTEVTLRAPVKRLPVVIDVVGRSETLVFRSTQQGAGVPG